MAQGDIPDSMPLVDAQQRVTLPWLAWIQRAQNVVVALYSSGATADRPTKLVWVGRPYFDTTLGKPVWVKTYTPGAPSPVTWVDATGTTV
jgi:hypothetical protein